MSYLGTCTRLVFSTFVIQWLILSVLSLLHMSIPSTYLNTTAVGVEFVSMACYWFFAERSFFLQNFSSTIGVYVYDRLWHGSWQRCCYEVSVRKPISRLTLTTFQPISHTRSLRNIPVTGLLHFHISLIFGKLSVSCCPLFYRYLVDTVCD